MEKAIFALFRCCVRLLIVAGVLLAVVLGALGVPVTFSTPVALILALVRSSERTFSVDTAIFLLYGLLATLSLLLLSVSCFRGLRTLLTDGFPSEAPVWFCLAGAALTPSMLFTLLLEPWASGLVHAALVMLVFDLAFWTGGLGLGAMSPPQVRQPVPRWLSRPFCAVLRLLSSRMRLLILLALCCLTALSLGLWLFQPLDAFLPWLLTGLWSGLWCTLLFIAVCSLLRRPVRISLRIFSLFCAALALVLLERLVLRNLITWLFTAGCSFSAALFLTPFLLAPAALPCAAACTAYLHSISEVKA